MSVQLNYKRDVTHSQERKTNIAITILLNYILNETKNTPILTKKNTIQLYKNYLREERAYNNFSSLIALILKMCQRVVTGLA